MQTLVMNVRTCILIICFRHKVFNLVEVWYSLEQYIGCRKTSYHPLLWTSSGLKGTWKLSAYISLVSLRCAKTVINW